VLKTVQSYNELFTSKELDGFIYNYVHHLSPLSQTVFARLFMRKRIWFNQYVHLTNYIRVAKNLNQEQPKKQKKTRPSIGAKKRVDKDNQQNNASDSDGSFQESESSSEEELEPSMNYTNHNFEEDIVQVVTELQRYGMIITD